MYTAQKVIGKYWSKDRIKVRDPAQKAHMDSNPSARSYSGALSSEPLWSNCT